MPKVKVPRKSTTVDMTAMCDVAFLLLSFFILTTKFKPSDALTVVTPNSVANKVAPQTDAVLITIDKEGRVYFSVSDQNTKQKQVIIEEINKSKSLNLTPGEMNAFKRSASYVGVPFTKLKSYLGLNAEQVKKIKQDGIPVLDSANNQLIDWMRAAQTAFQGMKVNWLVKGDNASKYPSFQGVIKAFKNVKEQKFQMITNPENVPPGTELYRKNSMGASGTAVSQ